MKKILIALSLLTSHFYSFSQIIANGGFELVGNPHCGAPYPYSKGLNYSTSWRGLTISGNTFYSDWNSLADIFYIGKTETCIDPATLPYAHYGSGMAKLEFKGGTAPKYTEFAATKTTTVLYTNKTYKIEGYIRYTTYDQGGVGPLSNGNNPYSIGFSMVPQSQSSTTQSTIYYAMGNNNSGLNIEDQFWIDGYVWKKLIMYFTPTSNEQYNLLIGAFSAYEGPTSLTYGLYIDDISVTELNCVIPNIYINNGAFMAYACNGVMPTLNASTGAGYTYQWFNNNSLTPIAGATNASYTPSTTGIYYAMVSLPAGCVKKSSVITVEARTITLPAIKNYSTNAGQAVQVGFSPLSGSYSYSWNPVLYLSNSNISNPYCTTSSNMNYTLTVTEPTSGCKAYWNTKVFINVTPPPPVCCGSGRIGHSTTADGDEKNIENNINLFPNPTQGPVTVSINNSIEQNFKLMVIDILGKVILEKSLEDVQNNQISVELSNHPRGIYYLKITSGSESITKKIILD